MPFPPRRPAADRPPACGGCTPGSDGVASGFERADASPPAVAATVGRGSAYRGAGRPRRSAFAPAPRRDNPVAAAADSPGTHAAAANALAMRLMSRRCARPNPRPSLVDQERTMLRGPPERRRPCFARTLRRAGTAAPSRPVLSYLHGTGSGGPRLACHSTRSGAWSRPCPCVLHTGGRQIPTAQPRILDAIAGLHGRGRVAQWAGSRSVGCATTREMP